MPQFRAINQLSQSPLKPNAGKRQVPDTMSRPKRDENQARPSVVVPILDKPNGDKPRHKSDLRQAVAKAKKASDKPKKKKRRSASSTSKPRRQQAVREKKLMPSIEFPSRNPTGSPTPECANDRADGDYVPSKAELADISMSSASNTPSRRSPRKHPTKCRNIGLIRSAHVAVKRDSSPRAITARPPSPSLWSPSLRRKLYKRDEFVELPKDVFERKQRKKEKRIKKEAHKRKKKGKAAEQRPIEENIRSRQKMYKRKLEEELDQDKRHKRQKLEKSEKPRPEELVYDGRVPSEVLQTSKQGRAQRSSKGKTIQESDITDSPFKTSIESKSEGSKNKKVQPSSQAGAKAHYFPMHDARLDQPGDQAPRNSGQNFRPCSCSELLPDYFTRNPRYVPRLETWPGDAPQFFDHVKQISNCRGSIHPRHVVDACYWILKQSGRDENSIQSTDEVAQGFSSTSGRNDSNPRRAQSSIPPPVFYGKRGGCQPNLSTGSSVHQPRPNGNTECSASKGEAVETHDTPLIGQLSKSAKKPCNSLTTTNSSSLSQKRRIDEPGHPREGNDPPSGQENAVAKQISKILPDAPSILDRPQRSFEAQRQRHQSAPVNAVGRNTAVSERDLLLPSRPKRHDNALQEISNNAILQRVDELQKLQRAILERLPAIVPTQVAAAGPVSAAAASATAPTQGGNGVDQAPARRRKKKPSRAERQLKYPKLDRNVPEHLVHTDDQITEIGRIVHWYERHAEAPEAFDYDGRLYAKYKPLLVRIVDGVPVWTAEEISRITR